MMCTEGNRFELRLQADVPVHVVFNDLFPKISELASFFQPFTRRQSRMFQEIDVGHCSKT